MKRQYLLLLFSLFFVFGFTINSTGQKIKNGETKQTAAKVQHTASVSIFQVKFENADENLQTFLTKNQAILHFRGEADSNVYVIYLETGNTRTDLSALLKNNDINQFEIIRSQQGIRKTNLFNKRF